jgi:VCBS repeat-containing protein
MAIKEKILRLLVVLSIVLSNTKITIAHAANVNNFTAFNSENMSLSGDAWSFEAGELSGGAIVFTGNSGTATYILDVSSIASLVDMGHLEISFSADATVQEETTPGEIDTAAIQVGFGAGSSSPDSTVQLERGTNDPGSARQLSSGAAIPAGTRYIFVIASGSSENDPNTASFSNFSLVINTSNPTLSYGLSPSGWTNSEVTVSLNAADSDSGIEGIYSNGGTKMADGATYSFSTAANGSWSFYALDFEGNASDVIAAEVSGIDTTVPAEPLLSVDTSDWSGIPVGFVVTASGSDEGPSPVTLQYRLAGGEWQGYSGTGSVSENGEIAIEARAIDAAGNASTVTAAQTVRVDTQAPEILLSYTAHQTPAYSATVHAEIADAGSGVAVVRYASGSQDAAYFADGSGDVLLGSDFETIGGGTYTVYAVDEVGNAAAAQITVDTYPVISSISAQTLDEDTTLAVPFTLNDLETPGGSLVVSASSANQTLLPDPVASNMDGAVSLTLAPAADKNGSTSVTVSVTDGAGLVTSATFGVQVNAVDDAPMAEADAYSLVEDTPLNVTADLGVLSNDSDADGDSLSVTLVDNASNGTLVLNPDGSFEYSPDTDFSGSDSFSYQASDGALSSGTTLVTLTVTPINDSPVAVGDSYSTNEDTQLVVLAAGGLLANDTDSDSTGLAVEKVTDPAHGTLHLNADGSFTYDPAADFTGSDSFTYRTGDGNSFSTAAQVSITVEPVDDAPVASADTYSTDEDTPLSVDALNGVLANDTDVENDTLLAVQVDLPIHGTLVFNSDGSFLYTPDTDFNGSDQFSYYVSDGVLSGNTVTVTIDVASVNDSPLANDDTYSINEDAVLTVVSPGVLANDTDAETDALTAVLVADVSHGTLALNSDGSFSYTPGSDFNGEDQFTYHANDGQSDGNDATVYITVDAVNDPPVGQNDSYSTPEDVPLVVSTTLGVLANDDDVDSALLTVVQVEGPAHGLLELNADGSFTYTPDLNYNGADGFTYQPSDGALTGDAVSVSITVDPVNDAPIALDDSIETNEDTPLEIAVLANDSDVENSPLTAILVTDPQHGTASVNPDGTIHYAPALDYNGTDTFTYKVTDGALESNPAATVTVVVLPVNDAPVAVADGYSTNEDTLLSISAAGVLGNDTDVESNPLTAHLVSGTTHGVLNLSTDGSFTYAPDLNFNGSDTFTYLANDGSLDGNTVIVTLTVTPANDVPVALADAYETSEDTELSVSAGDGVLANDSDIENSPLSSLLVDTTSHGSLVLNTDGSFTYTPSADYNGPDSFTYKPFDGSADGNTVTVSLTVNPVNDGPVAKNDSATLNEDIVTTINVLANDSDVDLTTNPGADHLTLSSVGTPSHGSAAILNNQAVYTPALNYNGTDSFTYVVTDDDGLTATATVTLTINPVNDYPAFTSLNAAYTTDEDTPITITFNIGDIETPTESLMLQVTSGDSTRVTNANLVLGGLGDANPTTTLRITPVANANGDVTITMHLGDGFLVTVGTFVLHITPVNDPPVPANNTYNFTEDTPITIDMDNLVSNDTDIDHDTLSFVSYSAPSLAGTLTVLDEAAHTYTFTPNANFDGTTSFQYTMTDGTVNRSATVYLVAIPVNDAPTIVMDAGNPTHANEDEPATLGFTIHDWETAASLLAVQAGSSEPTLVAPTGVAISCNSSGACTATVTPSTDQNGSLDLTFSVSDGMFLVPETVPFTFDPVEDAPTAIDDVYSVEEDATITFTPMENDFDVDTGDTISFVSAAADAGIGTLTYTSAGAFTYTPPADFSGIKTFTYTITDGTLEGTATVTLNVNPTNNPPVISPFAHQYTMEDTSTGALAFTVSSTGGDPLTVTATSSDSAIVPEDSGHITIENISGSNYTITLLPDADAFGDTTITITADNGTYSSSASFTLTVYPVNDLPVAVDDAISTDEDTAVTFNPLANDTDIETANSGLRVVQMSTPAHGQLAFTGTVYRYTPDANYNGTDTLTYTMTDGAALDTATVTITVGPVNDAPVAENDWVTLVNLIGSLFDVNVLGNDYDIDAGDSISLVGVVSDPSYGSISIIGNTIRYIRTGISPTGSDSFVYEITDSGGLTATATVYFAISWAPSVSAHNAYLAENEDSPETSIPLGINDGKGDGWTLEVLTTPTLGTISYNSDNGASIAYTPNADANGSETLTYRITSKTDSSLTSTAHVYITLYPVNDLPEITDVADQSTPESTTTGDIAVTINDVDNSVDSLTFNVYSNNQQLVSNNGIHVTRTAGSGDITFTITPLPDRYGTAVIEMLVSDSIGYVQKSFTLTVNQVNSVPVALDYCISLAEDRTKTFTVIAPNADADGDPLTLSILSGPSHGVAIVNSDQTVTYTPSENYEGPDSFVYQLDDGNGGTDTGTVSITVVPVDDAPVISNLDYLHSTLEDTPAIVTFTVSDIDTALADLEVTFASSNTSLFPVASIVASGDGADRTVTLTPAANLSGTATITMRVSDGTLYDQKEFQVVVDPVNDLPVAVDDTTSTNEDTSVRIGVVVNDWDVEDMTLTVASLTSPAHGSVVNNRDGTVTYQPATNWNGTDSFTYTVVDSNNGSDTAAVTVTVIPVNDAPNANTDYVTILEDNSVTIRPLSNDTDVESDPISLVSYGSPSHGTLVKNADNSFLYTPTADYYGSDLFTYVITDGTLNSTGTVRITITAVNDAPRLTTSAPLPWTLYEDTPTSFPIHIYDPETPADNLVIEITSSSQLILPDTSINLNGSGMDKTLLLTPNLNKFGTLDIQIEATDGELTTTEVFPVLVVSVNDPPTISDVHNQTIDEDTSTSALAFTVTDIETAGGDLVVTADSSNPALIPVASIVINNPGTTARTVTVTPVTNKVGSSTITLTVTDADGGTATDTFVVTVTPRNDAPVAYPDESTTPESQSVEIDVLANDTDVDLANEGDVLIITSTSGVDNGSVIIAGDKKSLTFTPNANWNGEEQFQYTIADSAGSTSTSTVTVWVTQVNDPPVAEADARTMDEDTGPVTILVLENDSDLDFDSILNHPVTESWSVTAVTQPTNGDSAISSDGQSVTYSPDLNWYGSDEFTYTVTDHAGSSATATVTMTVNPVNDPPTITTIPNQTIDEDTSTATLHFTVNDVDNTAGSLMVTAESGNTAILPTLTLGGSDADRTIVVTPAPNKNTYLSGPITITLTVTDASDASATSTFTVTVNRVNDAPVAPTLATSMNEDASLLLSPISSSVDVDLQNEGDTVLINSVDGVDHGSVIIAPDETSMTFTPTANWNGIEEFTYTLIDAAGATSTATATITVNPVNDTPVAAGDSATVNEDSGVNTILVLSNDSDVDFDSSLNHPVTESWSITAVTQPASGGTAAIKSGSQAVTFTPTANWNGATSFTYTVTDGSGAYATATVSVTVTPVNDLPTAVADSTTMNEDGGTRTINVLTNDRDDDLTASLNHPVTENLLVTAVTQPSSGTAAIVTGSKSVTYTPVANWNGSVTFTYTITDSGGITSTANVTVTVNAVNDNPTAVSDSVVVAEDSSATIVTVLDNDTDIDLDTSLNHPVTDSLSVSAVTQPAHGTAAISSGSKSVTYTPPANWNGSTSFTYTARDSGGRTSIATVSVTVTPVNDAPQAVNDTASMSEDGSPLTIAVLSNDSDVDFNASLNNPVTESWAIVSITQPINGSVAIDDGNLTVTYTPPANWNGNTSFTYTVRDAAGATAVAMVTVAVFPINDPPTISDIPGQVIDEDHSTGVISFSVNDIDTPLADLTITATTSDGVVIPGASIVFGGSNGTRTVTVTPAANKNTYGTSPVTITVTVTDTGALSASDSFTVTVLPANDAPVANNDSVSTAEDTALTIHPLANDSDVDSANEGDAITLSALGTPAHGLASIEDATTISYTPSANWNGSDSFTYTISDSHGATATATITVIVTPVNDAPVAVDDTSTVLEDSSATTVLVLGNDHDVDFDAALNHVVTDSWNITGITQPAHGTAAISGDGQSVAYTPPANWNGTTTFTYTVSDSQSVTATAEVTMNVTPVNDAPVAQEDTATVNEDSGTTSLNVLANDSDVDFNASLNNPVTESWSISVVTQPGNGSVAIHSGGLQVDYTPAANWNGSESFTYTVEDNAGASSTATVQVTVLPQNDAPLAVNDGASVNEDESVEIPVLANDTDTDLDVLLNHPVSDVLLVSSVGVASIGTAEITGGGTTVTYTPPANWNGSATFAYTVSDSSGATSTATVTVTVNPVNDAPVAVEDTYNLDEDDPTQTFEVLSNDSDVDFNILLNHPVQETWEIVSVTDPSHGAVAIASDGLSVSYSTELNWNGVTSFTYTVEDQGGLQSTAEVTLNVSPKPDSPVAVADSGTVDEDGAVMLYPLENDTDPDLTREGDTLHIESVEAEENCSVEIAPDGTSVQVTPDTNFNGTATFRYTIEDSTGNKSTAVVTVTVNPLNDAPVAVDDSFESDEDIAVTLTPLENDSDVDFDPLLNNPVTDHWQITAVTMPAHGTATIAADGLSVDYDPDDSWNGVDQFDYTVTDASGAFATATITVTVAPVNDPPVISDVVDQVVNEDTSTGALEFTVSDIDNLADSLVVSAQTDNGVIIPLSHVVLAGSGGTRTVTVTPATNFNTFGHSPVHILLTVSDGELTDSDTFAVTILPVNDPPSANADSATMKEDTQISLNLLSNDNDVDMEHEGDSLKIASTSGVSNGTATISTDGQTLIFTPTANWYGVTSFQYTMEDSHGAQASAQVTITVTSVPDPDTWLTSPDFYVITPAGGERYKDGQTVHVTWSSAGAGRVYKLQFFDGDAWHTLAQGLTGLSYNHDLIDTHLHTSSAKYRVVVTLGSQRYLAAESGFFTIDNRPPQDVRVDLTTYSGLPYTSGTWTNGPVIVSVSGGWDLTGVEDTILVDGAIAKQGAGSLTATVSGDGKHTVKVVTHDPLGNEAELGSYQVWIDTQAPLVPGITAGQPDAQSGRTVTFSFKEDPGGSGNAFLFLPDGTKVTLDGDYAWHAAQNGTFGFTLVDNAGNQVAFEVVLQGDEPADIHAVASPSAGFPTPVNGSTATPSNGGNGPARTWGSLAKTTGAVAGGALGLLGLFLLLFLPAMKVIAITYKSDGKADRRTCWRWPRSRGEKHLMIAVPNADEYEVELNRVLTRSLRGGKLSVKPASPSNQSRMVNIPGDARNRYTAFFK